MRLPRVFLATYEHWQIPGTVLQQRVPCDICNSSEHVTGHGYRFYKVSRPDELLPNIACYIPCQMHAAACVQHTPIVHA